MYMQDVMTVPANLAGLPSVSVPAGVTPVWGREGDADKLTAPAGLQLIGRPLEEGGLLRIASVIERYAAETSALPSKLF